MPILPDPGLLARIPLFHDLTPEQLSWLNDHLHRKTFPPGSNIATVEQPGEVIYIILEGTVKIYVDRVDGTSVILAILGPGDIVGEMSLVDSSGRSANVVTLETSDLLWMERSLFQECLQQAPAITYNLVGILSRRLRLANEQIQALATMDIHGRIARQILAFAQQYGQTTSDGDSLIPIRLTQSDLADLVGASRERVNQVMVHYKRHKYISVSRNYRITILDRAALAQHCL